MNKGFILIGAVVVSISSGAAAASAHDEGKGSSGGMHEGTIQGVISDSMCKFDHSAMIKAGYGKDAASCIKKCASKGSKLVLADKKDNAVYTFTNSKLAKSFAGKSVAITGHIDLDTRVIHIHGIKAQ